MLSKKQVKAVGAREFREKLAEHLVSGTPIAVTKHGLTMGYYIPTHHLVSPADKESLVAAAQRLNALLAAEGVDPESLLSDYKALRQAKSE